MPGRIASIAGQRFGMLVAIREIQTEYKQGRHRRTWYCACDCGGSTNATQANLRRGGSRSCGCRSIGGANNKGRLRHGMCRTPEYNIWLGMKRRCYDETDRAYKNYGGRGISVSLEWSSAEGFPSFIRDMGLRPTASHTLDRIDNDGNYCESNCRWATRLEQSANKRNNRWITFGAETRTLSQWMRFFETTQYVIEMAVKNGTLPCKH